MSDRPTYYMYCGEIHTGGTGPHLLDSRLILHDHGGATCDKCIKTTLDELNGLASEIARLKAELEAVTAQRDDAQGMIHGAKELVSESLRALKHADKAITREAWQSGPTIEEARKVILGASKNIEEYGVDGYANALRLARSLCVRLKGERNAANADADLLAEELSYLRDRDYGEGLWAARAAVDASPTAKARVEWAARIWPGDRGHK